MDKDLLQNAKAPMIALIEKKNIVENKMKRAAALLLMLGLIMPLAVQAQDFGNPSRAIDECRKPTELTVSQITTNSAQLSWIENGEATAWQICVNDDEENVVDADTNPYALTGLNPVTEYTVKVRANCGSEQSAWSTGLTFTTPCGAFALPYSYGFENADDLDCWEVIATSSSSGIATYGDAPEGSKVFRFNYTERNAYLASPVFSGTEQGLDVTFQYMNYSTTTSYTEQFQVGYTTDESAAPADFTYGDTIYGENQWVTYANTFPPNTKRIAIKYIYTNGWYLRLDDFNFGSASCPRPRDLAADNITATTADLSWTENGTATTWQIGYQAVGGTEQYVEVTENPYTLTGLTPGTVYKVRVQAKCGDGEYSSFTSFMSFTTPCEAFALPYSYGFEDAGDLDCWEVIATSPNTGIATYADAPEGSKVFRFSYTERNAYLASPVFSGTEHGLDVAFQYMNYSTTSNYAEQFQVGYTTDADAAPADFTYGETIYGENHWVTYANAFPANTKRIAIKYIYTYGMYLRLDDFNFESASCPIPTDLTAGTLGLRSVELSWTETGEATAWQICVNDDEENLIDADTNPYTLTGLTPATEYTVKVRANCGAEQSAWSNGLTFATYEAIVDLPYSYGFEDAGDLDYWEVIATSPYTGIGTAYDAPEGSKVFRFYGTEQNAYLTSPVFYDTELGLDVTFQYMNNSTTTPDTEQFQVGYTTDAGAAPADFTYGDTIHGVNHWVTYANTFPANTKRIAIKYIHTNGIRLRLDDFNFGSTSCPIPADLTAGTPEPHSVELSWTETGEATAWQICVNDDEENLIDADTNPYALTGLNPVTEYTVKVRANCGSEQSAWSNGLTFTTPCGAFVDLPYSYGFEDAGDLVCWEVIATSPNTGIATADDAPEGEKVFLFYYDEQNAYLASPVFSGTELGLDVTFQYMNSSTTTSYTEQFQVGYTTDADAAPADFTYGDTIYGENHWVWYENTFPANTKRIAIKHIHTNGSYLRLDDFNFEPTPSCPRPRNLTAGTHGLHSVELGWTERGEATAWQICLNDDEENLIDADTNPYMLTGLTPETEYTVKVRANCGSEQSAWSNGLTFTIPCGAFALPYSYGFEDAGDLDCWKVIATHPNTGIATVSDAPEGSKVFRFDRTEQNAYLASPVFSGTEQGLDVAFQYMNHSLPIPRPEQFQVGYTTDADAAPADFTYGDTIYGENHWVRYENTFPANTKRIAIKYIYTYGWFLRLDDFSFEAVPSCPRPADLTAGTPEPHSVELGWTETGEATAWQICVNDDEENLIDADTNLYTLTGLNPATEYTVKVRANCGSEQSAWSNGLTFTTPCGAFVALPYSYGFENAGDLDCWEVIATNPNTGIATYADAPEGSKVFRFDYRERNAYLASPVFSGTELGLDVTFQYMNYNTTTSYTEQFQVGYTTDAGAAPADFIYGDIIYGENHWAWYENTFPANTKRIAIKYIYTDGHYLRLDDFNFESASCPRPTNLTAGAHGLYSVELGWTETGEATAWQICVNDDEENLIDADTNLYTLTGLTPRTEYTVKVRANCGSEQSAWSNGLTFTTPCEAFDLPYSYGFEDAGDLDCWKVIATHPNTGIATVSDAPEGSKVFLFYYDEQNAYLASPVFSGTELGLDVTFQYMNSSTTTSYTEQFQVGYTTDADAASADFIYGDTIYGENLWVTYENTFPANTKRIAIKHIHTNGSYLRLDDFNFEIVSSCPRPRNLTAGIPEPHSVELGWTERGEATAWQICLNDDEENLIDADTNLYTLTGLNPRTEYTVKVRANCGSEQSAWSNGLTFTTPCGGFVDLPYSYGFEDAGDLDCWEVIATSPNTGIATVDDAPEGSKVFRFHYIEHNAYLVSLVFSGTEAGLSVSFQYMNSSTSNSKAEQFRVGYTTEADAAPADFIYGDTIYGETQWVTYENNFPANTKRIAIKYIYTGGTYLRLDDFNFESASCPRPTNLTAESITATTADLSWNGSPDAESFTVRYRTPAGMDALFTEDFEDETSFSNWTFISMNTANAIGTSNGAGRRAEAAHSGSYGFRFSSYSRKSDGETYDQYIVSPELTVTGELSFYFKKPYNSGEHLYLGYSTTTNDLEAFTWTEDLAPTQSWQQYTQDLPTDVKYIAFHYFGDYVHYVYVDDIVIGTEIPAGEWETVSTTEMNVTQTGLTPNTLYEAQVKGNCGEDDESRWSEIAYFTTDEGITLTKPITGYGTGAGGYYLIASPVMEDVTPTAGNGFLTNGYDLYFFDQSQIHEEWQNWKVNNFNLVSGKGYLYASQENTTLVFGGTPYPATNPVEVPLDYDGTVPDFAGWNLVGNPFAETAFVDREFYVMNGEGSEIVTAEGNTVEGMEGIFVVADGENESVTFTLASQNANANNASLVVSLSQNRCSVIDRAIVRFDSHRTLPKFQINPSSTKVYIPQGGKDYAVVSVCRDGVHTVSTEMPINFKAAKNGTYTLTFDTKNVAFDYLHLIDNLTGADVDLVPLCKGGQGNSTTQPATYTFTAQTTDYASRFRLVFSVCEDASDAPFAYISNGNIVITADAPGASLQVIDVMGRIIRTVGLSQRDNRTTTVGMPAGVYVLRLIDGNSVRMQKLVIE